MCAFFGRDCCESTCLVSEKLFEKQSDYDICGTFGYNCKDPNGTFSTPAPVSVTPAPFPTGLPTLGTNLLNTFRDVTNMPEFVLDLLRNGSDPCDQSSVDWQNLYFCSSVSKRIRIQFQGLGLQGSVHWEDLPNNTFVSHFCVPFFANVFRFVWDNKHAAFAAEWQHFKRQHWVWKVSSNYGGFTAGFAECKWVYWHRKSVSHSKVVAGNYFDFGFCVTYFVFYCAQSQMAIHLSGNFLNGTVDFSSLPSNIRVICVTFCVFASLCVFVVFCAGFADWQQFFFGHS